MNNKASGSTNQPGQLAWPQPHSLRRRILSWLGIATLIVFTGVSLGVNWFTFLNEQAQWQARQTEAALHAARMVDDSITHSEQALALLGYLGADHFVDDPDFIELLAQQNPGLLDVTYLDRAGRTIAGASAGTQVLGNAAGASQTGWFQQAANGRNYRGPVQFSPQNEPYLIAAAPATAGNVVAARVGLIALWDVTASTRFGRTGFVYVVDETGAIIASPDRSNVLIGSSIQNRPELAAIMAAPNHQWTGNYTNGSGQAVAAAAAPVPGSGWIVISEVSQAETAETSRGAFLVLLAGLLILEIAATMVVRQALQNEIFRPLALLREGAGRIGGGDLEFRIPVKRWDEIGQVSAAFNAMADHLRRHRGSQERHGTEMEAVYQIGLSLTASLDLQSLAEVVLQATFRMLPELQDSHIFLYDQDHITFLASRWWDGRRNVLVNEPRPNGLTYSVARGGQMILIPDLAGHPLYSGPETPWQEGAIAGIPLRIGQRVVGVMNVAYSRAHGFSDRDLRVLQLLADQAAIAVENARLYGQVQRELLERERTQLALARSQARYRAIVEDQAELVCRFAPDGAITFANLACRRALRLPTEDGTSANLFAFLPQDAIAGLARRAGQLTRENPVMEVELRIPLKGGRVIWQHWTARAIYDDQGNRVEFQGTGRDVTERVQHQEEIQRLNSELENRVAERTEQLATTNRCLQAEIVEHSRAEQQIRASLREKDLLLKEIHHRVKNNLQIVASLLNLQSSKLEDRPSQEILRDSQNRVRSMAMIHERLYRSHDMAHVDMADYVRGLTASLFRSYHVSTGAVTLDVRLAEDVTISIDAAIPCGLIINELVSNALKHAFPGGRRGRLGVEMGATAEGLVSLTVSDDGVGIPESLDWRNTESLGLQLVITLVDQLNGTIELWRGGGASFHIVFATTRQ